MIWVSNNHLNPYSSLKCIIVRLKKGNILVCILEDMEDLTYGKRYEIVHTRDGFEDDICIKDDLNLNWWFGQVGVSESWVGWFVTEKQWERDEKLQKIGII